MSHHNERFARLYDREGGLHFADMSFENCEFSNCFFSMRPHILRRSTASHVQFTNCTVVSVSTGPAIIEDCTVDGLETKDILILWSPFLTRTTFRGRIGEVKINSNPGLTDRSEETRSVFAQARAAHYAAVDWALDISEGTFEAFSVSGIPLSLIRRDPQTQVIVKRGKAGNADLRARVAPWNTYWLNILDVFLGDPDDEFLLVAPVERSKKQTQERIDGLRNLQDVGIAEIG